MKKIFTLIAALTLSVGLWATSIWSGSQAVHWDNTIMIEKGKFADALPGNKITVTFSHIDTNNADAIEFRANGHKLPGTRFSLCQDWWETYDLFMTQDMVDSCKVYGMEICGDNFTVTNIDLSEGKAGSMKKGKAIWTGYFWVTDESTLQVFKEALDAVKDWSKYSAMRFYSECPTTDNLIFLLADWTDAGVIAKSEPATDDEAATNPLKRYEGYAELDLTKVNPLTFINNVASDRLMMMMDMQGSAPFNFTDVVLVEQTAPVEGDQFVDATSGLKFEVAAVGEANTMKVMKNDYTGTSYTVPATVSYQSVTFNVTEIGKGAFEGCSSLESVTIPASVTTIGQDAFHKCESLQSVTLSENLTTIEEAAFHECPSLASITIPAGVTAIGVSAFAECAGLTSVTFLGNACQNNIGEMAFNSVGSTTPATLVLPANWTGTKPDEDGNWYGGKFELSEDPKVDETGITVNGRKYGFPVRLVKEVK